MCSFEMCIFVCKRISKVLSNFNWIVHLSILDLQEFLIQYILMQVICHVCVLQIFFYNLCFLASFS